MEIITVVIVNKNIFRICIVLILCFGCVNVKKKLSAPNNGNQHIIPQVIWNILGVKDSNPETITQSICLDENNYRVTLIGTTENSLAKSYRINYNYKLSEGEEILFGLMELHKTRTTHNGDDSIYVRANFIEGQVDGDVIIMRNNKLMESVSYSHGTMNGFRVDFDINGNLSGVEFYDKEGKKDGQSFFFRDRKLKEFTFYKEGEKCGVYQKYSGTGKLKEQGINSCEELIIVYKKSGDAEVFNSKGDTLNWKEDFTSSQKVKFWDYVGKQNFGDTLKLRLPYDIVVYD